MEGSRRAKCAVLTQEGCASFCLDGWWWWSRRDVDEMCLSIPHHSAPDYGGHVPVDMTPTVHTALKNPPSAHLAHKPPHPGSVSLRGLGHLALHNDVRVNDR